MITDLVAFAILGLGSGALIAALGVAAVLQSRGSDCIDMSLGAVAMLGAYTFYSLRTAGELFIPVPFVPLIPLGGPWPTVPSFAMTVVVCIGYGVAVSRFVMRRLSGAAPLAKLAASLGLLLVLQSIVVLRFGTEGAGAPAVLPRRSLDILGVGVGLDRVLLGALAVGIAVLMQGVYRLTPLGLATRAVAANERGAVLVGLIPHRIAMANTVMAYSLAGGFGILAAPTSVLDPMVLTYSVVPAMGAALLGRLASFTITTGAGLLMGCAQSILVYLQSKSWFPTAGNQSLPGVIDVVYVVVIIVALTWRGDSIPRRGALEERSLPPAPRPARIARPTVLLVGAGAALAYLLPSDYRQAFTNSLVGIVLCLSLVVITGFVGQVSLMQTALAGTAAFVLFRLAEHGGIPFPVSALLAIGAAVGIGGAAGIPALRVRGVHLAIVTMATAVAIERFGFGNSVWGDAGILNSVPPPRLLGTEIGPRTNLPGWDGKIPSPAFGLFCLAVVAALAMLVASLRRSSIGQRMLAVRSNERAAAAGGLRVPRVKIGAFLLSSGIAGVAGVLSAYNFGSVSSSRFGISIGLVAIAAAYVGGITTVSGALFGGALVAQSLPSYAMRQLIDYPIIYEQLIAGVSLILVVLFLPEGLALAHAAGKSPILLLIKAFLWVPRKGLRALHPTLQRSKDAVPRESAT